MDETTIRKLSDKIGDTFKNPKFRNKRGKLRTLDRVVANPMWNQDWFTETDYDADELDKRQKAILELAISTGSITNRQVQDQFKVVRDTAHRDLITPMHRWPRFTQNQARDLPAVARRAKEETDGTLDGI